MSWWDYLPKYHRSRNRPDMPQVRNKEAFLADLESRGIVYSLASLDSKCIMPSQIDIDQNKVDDLMAQYEQGFIGDSLPLRIIVSKDMFVLDGHHRFAAAKNLNCLIHCIVVNMTIADLLVLAPNLDGVS